MSTLEKAVNLLYELPEQALETVYTFMQFVQVRQNGSDSADEETLQLRAKLEAVEQARLSGAPAYTLEESRKRLEEIYSHG